MNTEHNTTEETADDWLSFMLREDPATDAAYAELCRYNAELDARAEILADGRYTINEGGHVFLKADHRCKRCGGTGHLTQFEHVSGGDCFRCDGTGVTVLKVAKSLGHFTEFKPA